MIRRLNYTGRKRIPRQRVAVHVSRPAEGAAVFLVSLDLGDLDLPLGAAVFLEAYRQTSLMRWPAGTVGDLQTAGERELTEFGSPEGVQFRVRVTLTGGEQRGIEVAEADGIRGLEADEAPREGLLPVRGQELDALAWRLDLDPQPILLVNRQLGDWRAIASHPAFKAFVLPAVLREVLAHVVVEEGYRDLDDDGDWRCDWLRFATRLPGADALPRDNDPEGARTWIEEAVSAFARVKEIDRCFLKFWDAEVA